MCCTLLRCRWKHEPTVVLCCHSYYLYQPADSPASAVPGRPLVLLILLATAIWIRYCLHDLRYTREFSQQRALFGEEITLSISLENAKMLPLPWVEIEDTVPRSLRFSGRNLRVNM